MKNRFISLFLAINIIASGFILTSCSKKTQNQEIKKSISVATEVPTEVPTEEPTEKQLITEEFIEQLKINIDNVNATYLNSEFFPTKKTIKEYKEMADSQFECPGSKEETIPDLYLHIKQNTIEQYGNDNKVFFPNYEIYDDAEKEMYHNFIYAIEDALSHIYSCENNLKEDICSLQSISMKNTQLVNETDGYKTLGIFDNVTYTVHIDYDAIVESLKSTNESRKEQGKEEISLRDYLTKIIEHEFNHVRQYPCKHRIENNDLEDGIGFYKDTPSFIIEASAESGVYNYNDEYGMNYKYLDNYEYSYPLYRESEALLMLLAAFKDNKTLDQYYEAIYDCDTKKLWEFFDLDNDKKLMNFYKIFYAINTLHGRTELAQTVYKDRNSVDRSELEATIGKGYLIDMLKFITKDIIDTTEKNELSMDDSLLLYLIAKSYLVEEAEIRIKDGDSYRHEFDEDFAIQFNEVEKNYKDYLCLKFNITEEELNDTINGSVTFINLLDFEDYIDEGYYEGLESMRYRYYLLNEKYPLLATILKTKITIYSYDDLDEYLETIDVNKVMTK